MDKIEVTNTAIIINDYHLGDCPKLEYPYKIFDPITHKYEYFGLYYDEEWERLYLPAGQDLWRIQKYFGEKYYHRIDADPFLQTGDIKLKYAPRDEKQLEALKFMCAVDPYQENKYYTQLSVNLNTGVGKTYCSCAAFQFYQLKTIVITGSSSLLDQWKSEIMRYTSVPEKEIMYIKGSNEISMILNGNSGLAKNAKIYLCTHKTLHSYADRFGWEKIHDMFKALGIGIKIFDEAHTQYQNMLMIDYFTNVYKTFYVTATPARSNRAENRVYQISVKNVPSIDLFNEETDPHTAYIAIKYNSKPSPTVISACKNKYGLDRMKYINYITQNENFYKAMRIVMDLIIKSKGRALIYIGTNEGIIRVYYWIATYYPEFLGNIGIFTSLVSEEQKQIEKQKRLILSTTKSAGLGEHIEHLKITVVAAEPFKSEVIARQTLGRTRDSNTFYIELVDLGFKYIRKFYYAKLPIFNKYATDTSDSTIDQYELDKRSGDLKKSREEKIARSPFKLADNRFDFSKVIPKNHAEIFNVRNPFKKVDKK